MIPKKQAQTHVTIVIDAFRAFATASYVLEQKPATYILTTKCAVISRLSLNLHNSLKIGKPEKGSSIVYDIPNSPTRTKELQTSGRNILHRTEAGAKGILLAKNADMILAAGFINAEATVKHIKTLSNPIVTIIPMGHEATTPTLEDDICAMYIEDLINNKKTNLAPFLPALRKGPGRYFFSKDQWQYPSSDFEHCLETGRFNFVIKAMVENDDYAILMRSDIDPSKKQYSVQSVTIQPIDL